MLITLMFPSIARFFPPWEPTEAGSGRGAHPALPKGQKAPAVPVMLRFTALQFQVQEMQQYCTFTKFHHGFLFHSPGTTASAFPAEGSGISLVVKLLKSS